MTHRSLIFPIPIPIPQRGATVEVAAAIDETVAPAWRDQAVMGAWDPSREYSEDEEAELCME